MSPLIKEAKELLAHLASVVDRLAERVAFAEHVSAFNGSTSRREHKTPRTGARRNGTTVNADALLAVLKAGKGLGLAEITAKVGGDKGAVAYRLNAMKKEKLVRVKGKKRAAVWLAA